MGFRVWDKGTFSAAFFSSLSQQLFSAVLGAGTRELFQQPFSALSELFSAAFLCYHLAVFMGWWSAEQFFLRYHLAVFRGWRSADQFFLSYHLAAVRGWWSAINIIFLWSGVGGQLVTSSCCGQGLVVRS